MKFIKANEMSFLERELALWLDETLIDEEQANGIRALYGVQRRPLSALLLLAGGALLGLGALSFAAANWRQMSFVLRTSLLVGAYAAFLAVSLACRYKGRYPLASRAFMLLANIVFGVGAFLIAGMYRPGTSLLDLLRLWIGEALLSSLLFRDSWQAMMSQALSLIYFIFTGAIIVFETGLLPASEFLMPAETWPLMAVLLAVTLWSRGVMALYTFALLTLALVESRVRACFGVSAALLSMALSGAALSLLPVKRWEWGDRLTDLISIERMGLVISGVFGLVLTYPEFWKDIFAKIPPFTSTALLAAGTAVALALLMLWQLHRGLAAGWIFLALMAARYFFDGIFDRISRAWGFTAVGVACLAIGVILSRRRGRNGDPRP